MGYCSLHGTFSLTTTGLCPQCNTGVVIYPGTVITGGHFVPSAAANPTPIPSFAEHTAAANP